MPLIYQIFFDLSFKFCYWKLEERIFGLSNNVLVQLNYVRQCCIQSYFEASIPVWDPKLKPPKAQVLISGISFRQCSLLQSQESNVLIYPEHKIAKNFQSFAPGPWTPLGRAYSAAPDSPAAQQFFSLLRSSKNRHPPKIAGYDTVH